MKSLTWKLIICALPIVISAVVVARAFSLYNAGEGGFNLGVDLVGGTILVYEVDQSRWPNGVPADYSVEKLTAKLKQRIDPADLYNVRITPLSKTRIEIVLPTGGQKYATHHEDEWQKLIDKVKEKWPPKEGQEDKYNVGLDQRQALINAVLGNSRDEHLDPKAVTAFVDENLPGRGEKRRSMTGEQVQRVKELISRVGSLKFVMLANTADDREGIEAAQRYFDTVNNSPTELEKLKAADVTGAPPPPPTPPDHKAFNTDQGAYTYSWIELGAAERRSYGLANDQENSPFWQEMAQARKDHKAVLHTSRGGTYGTNLFYSREVTNPDRLPEKDRGKKYEYFILTRDPERDEDGRPKAVTGENLVGAYQTDDKEGQLAVGFTFNNQGANLLRDLTTKNKDRQMAIVLDDLIQSAPNIQEPITGGTGIIHGNYTKDEVDRMVNILRSGALPASLKPQPVSENTMGATLGADTIKWGTISVVVAFIFVLAFMLVYYRFAGLVACVALLGNLLMTVAVMVLVNATFTLPGLAGLVLTLGMAVDANVLIYERLREERERGASLALAIRNGYDRAFGVIIDTHLSSIFTAIVLYVVGNDQLKGFGISLALGLIISLFTSLVVTRTLFDLWLSRGWLHKLSMMKLFSKPNIDFMAIRYYWFTATIILTILGAGVFFYRIDGHGGLNIDFTGGTKYSGRLKPGPEGSPEQYGLTIEELRKDLGEQSQKEKLAIPPDGVKQLDDQGNYQITYADGTVRDVYVNKGQDGKLATSAEVRQRAEQVPDLTVEQIFARGYSQGDRSLFFTVKTQEMSPDLVQAAIGRLLRDKDGKSLLQQTLLTDYTLSDDGKAITMHFSDFASPAQVQMLFEREFQRNPALEAQAGQFVLERVGEESEGHFKEMKLTLAGTGTVNRADVEQAVKAVQRELAERPQPESLENFDSALAADTQLRALYAILLSWGAILLYLWWRFGSWTFGLAAVLCLIHDLFFTLGFIGLAHFIHAVWPNNFLLIQDFKIDLNSVAALLTLVGYSVNDTIVVFDRIREVRGKNPELTPKMINDSVNQTLSRTLLTALSVWLVVIVLYAIGGEGVHLFAYVMVVGVIVGTYSSIYIASPLLLIFGEGKRATVPGRQPVPGAVRA